MNEDEKAAAEMSNEELAVAIKRHRSAALRGSGYLSKRGDELESELRRRAGIISEYGAPLRFASPPQRKWRWWWPF